VATLLKSSAKVDAQIPAKTKKAAVSLEHMIFLADTLNQKGDLERAALDMAITAFWGMVHLAELTYKHEIGPIEKEFSLLTSDVITTETDGTRVLHLSLRNAKTCAPGKVQHIQLKSLNNRLCPVRAVKRRLDEARGKDTSLFGYYADGIRHHLTRGTALAVIRNVWATGRFQGLSGHSFWVGGASLRAAMGVPIAEICELGRWTSDCYKLYIRSYSQEEVSKAKQIFRTLMQ
jgi:hypothetical protein